MQKFKLALILVLLVGCSAINPTRHDEVIKASTDQRSYRYVELPNQLKVLLVSDPGADKAAAAMDIYAGSMDEPVDQPGLAHFLEHMLFLGTDKYPQADEYQTYINQNGGSLNAFTAPRNTNYFFDISPEHFADALDRFSRFFVAPLFNEDYVQREKQAVNSEYLARIKDEGRRQMDALQQVMNPDHPLSRFSVGSLDTLKDTELKTLQQSLKDFYKTYYAANNMALVVMSPDSLDNLEQLVRQKFSEVPSFPVTKTALKTPIFNAERLPLLVEVEPEELTRELTLIFPIADDEAHYRIKPVSYIANLLGHEGEGSLLAAMKNCGWAESLGAGKGFADGSHATLQVSVSLTELGLEHWQQVSALTFNYIDLLRESGISRWRFQEQGNLALMQFNFKSNRSPIEEVSHLAGSLQLYPAQEVLRGPYIMDKYASSEIDQILEQLRVENVLVLKVNSGLETTRQSPYYQTPYQDKVLIGDELRKISLPECATQLFLPEANPYVPENFELIHPIDSAQRVPTLKDESITENEPRTKDELRTEVIPEKLTLTEASWVDAWYAPDKQFGTPKAQLFGKITTPAIDSIKGAALLSLYLAVVQDNLNKETYPARLAGLGYAIDTDPEGVAFNVSGFSDKLPLLTQRVVETFTHPEFNDQHVQRLKQTLIEAWRNTLKAEPYRQVYAVLPRVVKPNNYDPVQLAKALEAVTTAELEGFSQQVLTGKIGLRMLLSGNISRQGAEAVITHTAKQLGVKPANRLTQRPAVSLKQFDTLQSIPVDINHNDSAVVRYYQAANESYPSAAEFLLLQQVIKSPFFDQLRTQQQLGYIVTALDLTMDKLPGIGLLVQSPSANVADINQAMDNFLAWFKQYLATLDQQAFGQYRQGVINTLKEKPNNQMEQSQRFWGSIQLGYLNFDTREQLINQLQSITLEQLTDVYNQQFLANPKGLVVTTTK